MVVSGGSSSGRGLSVDRFYCPPALRRQLEQQRQQQLQQQETTLPKPVKAKPRPATPPAPAVEARIVESRLESDDSSKPSVSSSSSSASSSPSPSPSPPPRTIPPVGNLDRFLESTTPMVPAQHFSKTSMRGWRKSTAVESCSYFTLGDLWESFKEWSAYGAGVPLVLNGSDCVVQYYVPYLSGIQLYMDSSRTTLRSRRSGEDNVVEVYQNTSSDASSESEADRAVRKRRESWLTPPSHKDICDHLGEENDAPNQAVLPVFEYLEHDPPYGREPLADKISLLAKKFPQLKTYRSCDLLPSSWISVAWYPIYRIPTGPTLKDLDACFLTFHSLSTPLKNSCNGLPEMKGSVRTVNGLTQMPAKLSLPIFGLASYKFKGSIWINNELDEQQLASSLLEAAENWLKPLKVDHPDFRFFLSHYSTNSR
ncbi:hypothetical protein AXF42_Ash013894 [Apostasia shenzhenica]|uniref:DUF789 domain-containing protein n=1 Tax=Apostasia shenzhenica TaxID=1088818 RepID=A0A2I0AS63_9ASPA|nr:hypothetical protein AXF42_Ash013894 [Apostasia shenzhenica]